MNRNEAGQGIALDFLFAILVFLLVLNASLTLMDSSSNSTVEKGLIVNLQARASQTIDMLVRTEGSPGDWQYKSIDEAGVIGLAKRDRVLDIDKVNKFVEWAADYNASGGNYSKARSLLLIGYDYHFRMISYSGETLKEAPLAQPPGWDDMTAVRVKRIVNINGDEAIAELTIYYP